MIKITNSLIVCHRNFHKCVCNQGLHNYKFGRGFRSIYILRDDECKCCRGVDIDFSIRMHVNVQKQVYRYTIA